MIAGARSNDAFYRSLLKIFHEGVDRATRLE
jgi:hypothetical protein